MTLVSRPIDGLLKSIPVLRAIASRSVSGARLNEIQSIAPVHRLFRYSSNSPSTCESHSRSDHEGTGSFINVWWYVSSWLKMNEFLRYDWIQVTTRVPDWRATAPTIPCGT